MHKTLKLFILENCPYCLEARKTIEQLKQEDKYKDISIQLIDEAKEEDLANQYDYYYVPTFFLEDKKLHEGPTTKEIIEEVFNKYLEQ